MLASFSERTFALVSRDAHPLNPALLVEARREVYLCLLVSGSPDRRRAIKRIFVTTNLERLRLGATFLFREIARIGKTRAEKEEEGERGAGGRNNGGEGRRERGRKSDTPFQKCLRWKEGGSSKETEGERIAFLEIPVSLLRRV